MMSKRPLREHESVRITRATETTFVGDRPDSIILPAGATGAVIAVLGDADNPASYLVEVHLKETDEFAEANVPAEFLEPE